MRSIPPPSGLNSLIIYFCYLMSKRGSETWLRLKKKKKKRNCNARGSAVLKVLMWPHWALTASWACHWGSQNHMQLGASMLPCSLIIQFCFLLVIKHLINQLIYTFRYALYSCIYNLIAPWGFIIRVLRAYGKWMRESSSIECYF